MFATPQIYWNMQIVSWLAPHPPELKIPGASQSPCDRVGGFLKNQPRKGRNPSQHSWNIFQGEPVWTFHVKVVELLSSTRPAGAFQSLLDFKKSRNPNVLNTNTYIYIYLFIYLFIYILFIYLFAYLFVYLFVYLFIYLFIYLYAEEAHIAFRFIT